ncbi:MAG: hypothetical protein KBF88_01270 [Polyangiaceae bacterium]|nr:hypothetical protein [Polyangiaceae bacterium]
MGNAQFLVRLRERSISRLSTVAKRWGGLGFAALVVSVALVARTGDLRFRVAGTAVLLFLPIGIRWWLREAKDRLQSRGELLRTWFRTYAEADTERAIRALELDEHVAEGTSRELASLFAKQAVHALPLAQAENERSEEEARTKRLWKIALGAFLLVTLFNLFSVLEGIDLLFARRGEAPFALDYVDEVRLVARPPAYLKRKEAPLEPSAMLRVEKGTQILFEIVPSRAHRTLVLFDGKNRLPLVDDGNGHLAARWPVVDSCTLRVVALFGTESIPSSAVWEVESIPDAVPHVAVEGAPKTFELGETKETETLLSFEAQDDHGLREIVASFRSGEREERVSLGPLDGEPKTHRSAYRLVFQHPFVKRAFAPVEVRIEAKDNDNVFGPNWGKSEPVMLLPPVVGGSEVRRKRALEKLRSVLVLALAEELETPGVPTRESLELPAREELERALAELDALPSAATLRPRLRMLIERAVSPLTSVKGVPTSAGSGQKKASGTEPKNLTERLEKATLVVDATLRGLLTKDAKTVTRRLSDIADLLVLKVVDESVQKKDATLRVDEVMDVLKKGGESLVALGPLGRDIGEIVVAYLPRITRTRKTDSNQALLAAIDLATRLKYVESSFGAEGSGRGSGSESTGSGEESEEEGSSQGQGDGETDEVDQAFRESARDLEELIRDHQETMSELERAKEPNVDRNAFKKLAEEHIKNIRRIVEPLPTHSEGADSWTNKGSQAKELGEAMAGSLENGDPSHALEQGKEAIRTLEEAKGMKGFGRPPPREDLERKKKELAEENKWLEGELKRLQREGAEKNRSKFDEIGAKEEKLAERTKKASSQKGVQEEVAKPLEQAERKMREAGAEMRALSPENASRAQKEAQTLLEQAKQKMQDQGEDGQGGQDDGKVGGEKVEIKKDDGKDREAFRKRVLEGMAKGSLTQKEEALKRYTEGLLR